MPSPIKPFLIFLLLAAFSISCNLEDKKQLAEDSAVEIDLEAILKRGYITALVDNNSISYFIYKGRPMGYEYELLQLLAKRLNVTLKIKITSGVERAIGQLNRGEADILAFPLTVNRERKNLVAFTRPLYNSYQVLVQRKPEGWQKLGYDKIDEKVIRNPADLSGKEIHVLKGTSFELRLKNLSDELGADIIIQSDTASESTETLIKQVAIGEIDYTVANHTLAQVNAAYYPNLDVNTVLSVPQQIAWATRKNSQQLVTAVDEWLSSIKKEPTFMVIYNRYFKSHRTSLLRMKSSYTSFSGDKISPYDGWIKEGAAKLKWDWRLLASVIYQESKFESSGESWAGARGLMQLMPETAKRFGASNPDDPHQSILAGVKFLQYLDAYWEKKVMDEQERLKFILSSYNAGLSHIIDARKLTEKHGGDPNVWDGNVEMYLLKKSEPEFYQDAVVMAGYCKCEEPVNYIKDVLERFEEYKIHYPN
ncbi:MAG: transporter substrate-binding domain-containing protein [Cyclobacteriaceae bacterium]|nr:transporter substrate-binding domain-containing protein [Cyclobacteriaceae bacterium]